MFRVRVLIGVLVGLLIVSNATMVSALWFGEVSENEAYILTFTTLEEAEEHPGFTGRFLPIEDDHSVLEGNTSLLRAAPYVLAIVAAAGLTVAGQLGQMVDEGGSFPVFLDLKTAFEYGSILIPNASRIMEAAFSADNHGLFWTPLVVQALHAISNTETNVLRYEPSVGNPKDYNEVPGSYGRRPSSGNEGSAADAKPSDGPAPPFENDKIRSRRRTPAPRRHLPRGLRMDGVTWEVPIVISASQGDDVAVPAEQEAPAPPKEIDLDDGEAVIGHNGNVWIGKPGDHARAFNKTVRRLLGLPRVPE